MHNLHILTHAQMAPGAADLRQVAGLRHAIEGGLCYFNPHAAPDAAGKPETLAQQGGLGRVAAAFTRLEWKLTRLEPALYALIASEVAS